MVAVVDTLLGLLFVTGLAVSVRFVTGYTTVPYTVVLVIAGFALSLVDPSARLGFTLEPLFTHDVLLYAFLPAIVFQGATEINFEEFRRNLPVFGTMVLLGLPLAVAVVGLLAARLLGLPLLVALLFGSMVYPVDPVAVLSLFEEMGAPERLSILTEGESLLDDGVAIVVFTTIYDLVAGATPTDPGGTAVLTPGRLLGVAVEFLRFGLGGLAVGFALGYLVYRFQCRAEDHLNNVLLSFVAAYGTFVLAEHYLHVSGILGTVAAGLLLGTRGPGRALDEETLTFLRNTWEALVFFLNTVLFAVIGIQVPARQVLRYLGPVLATIGIVLLARAVVVYAITNAVNRVVAEAIPLNCQHVLVWSGLHGVIPVALALSLSRGVPYRDQLQTMVFGVVVGSMAIQGLLMPKVLRATGVVSDG